MKGLFKVFASSGGPMTALLLSFVYLYTRVPVGGGPVAAADVAAANPGPDPRGSLLGRLVRWMTSSGFARRTIRYRMRDGSRVSCRLMDSGGPLSIWVDGDYDLPVVDWSGASMIVDIGAHVGSFTVWAARRAPHARILAVEPNIETFALLQRNIRDNGLQDRVSAVNAAVGPAAGTMGLEFMEHSLGTRLSADGPGKVMVRVDTLSALLGEAGIDGADMLKMDCEGMEYDVIEGTGADRLRSIGALACEYHREPGRDVTTIDRVLTAAGFRVTRPDAPRAVLWATR
jgi:FkbM family methyltransferase